MIFSPDQRIVTYQAGYPVENSNGELTYRSKGGPTFRMGKGELQALYAETGIRNLDNFECKFSDIPNCRPSEAPVGGYNYVIDNDYTTGGGSSGSLVIDRDYNAIGIYWGAGPARTFRLPADLGAQSLVSPFYSDLTVSAPVDYTHYLIDRFKPEDRPVIAAAFRQAILLNYAKRRAARIWDDYTAQPDKAMRGLRFDRLADLQTDIVNFVDKKTETQQPESKTSLTDAQKKDALVMALLHLGQRPNNQKTLQNLIEKIDTLFRSINFTPAVSTRSVASTDQIGTIDYAGQLTEFFRANNIKTYSLNPVTPLK